MLRLEDLILNDATDKNTTHSYIPVYQELFQSKQLTATAVLEVGLGHGGSIKLWNDYFPNAEIHCLDINGSWGLRCSLESPRIHIQYCHAYMESSVQLFTPKSFDIVMDDGPHTLESLVFFAGQYSSLLKPDGILVIEDIQSIDWVPEIAAALPESMTYEVYDRRSLKDRYDDILLVATNKPEHA
jgi:hypothetical protein